MLSLACLILSAIEYLPYHLFLIKGASAAEIIYLLISGAVDLCLPVLFAAVLLVRSDERGRGGTLLDCLLLSLPRVAFYAPYFYMELFALGLELLEAILLALLIGILLSLAFGLFTLLLYGVSLYSYKRRCKSIKRKKAPSLSEMLTDGGAFDFSHPRAAIIAPSVILSFVANLPVVRAVEFFVNYGGSFVFIEILSIILETVFLLLLFLLSHILTVKFVAAIATDNLNR